MRFGDDDGETGFLFFFAWAVRVGLLVPVRICGSRPI